MSLEPFDGLNDWRLSSKRRPAEIRQNTASTYGKNRLILILFSLSCWVDRIDYSFEFKIAHRIKNSGIGEHSEREMIRREENVSWQVANCDVVWGAVELAFLRG